MDGHMFTSGRLIALALCHRPMSWSGWEYGSGFSSTPSITLKIAVLAPMPSARVSTVTKVNRGERARRRTTWCNRIPPSTKPQPESLQFLCVASAQRHNRRTPAAGFQWRVAELRHKFRSRKNRSHRLPLHADAPAVDDAQLAQTEPVRLNQIFFDYGFDVTWGNAVEVQNIGDGNPDRLFIVHKKAKGADGFTCPSD